MVEIQANIVVFWLRFPSCRDTVLATRIGPNERLPFLAGVESVPVWYAAVDSVELRCNSGVNRYSATIQWSSPISTVNCEIRCHLFVGDVGVSDNELISGFGRRAQGGGWGWGVESSPKSQPC